MIVRAFSLALALLPTVAICGLADKEREPMLDITAYSAVDGVVVYSNSKAKPYSLRMVGGDPRKVRTDDGQLWVFKGEQVFQLVVVKISQVLPQPKNQTGERDVLSAHATWEFNDHNKILQENQTAKPEFEEIGKRTWCHWAYDMIEIEEKLKKRGHETQPGPGPKTQQALTTVIDKNILVLIGTTMTGGSDDETRDVLTQTARTLTFYPKPLSPEQIKELCSQKQP